MAEAVGPEFVLFAASEPVRGDEGYRVASRLPRFRAFQFASPAGSGSNAAAGSDGGPPYEFPGEVGRCVRLAVELAESASVALHVIDLHQPGDASALVERWVTPETLFPLLVAPDGRRLEGAASFVPSTLRSFYRGR